MNLNWSLRHALRAQKMTGSKLAKASGMTIDSARVFLHGEAVDMRLSTLERIADAVDLEVKLVQRETNPHRS